jgi:hypothetical protein
MNRNVSQAARVLEVDVEQVEKWSLFFKDHLSRQANPADERPRIFTDSDVLALVYVAMYWEDDPDVESIRMGLNAEEHHADEYRDILYLNTPILQERPDDLDETWRQGFLLNGAGVDEYAELARNYRQGADALLEAALQSGEAREWIHPVLYLYRHTLELYLKVIGEIDAPSHRLRDCMERVEKRYGEKFNPRARGWMEEFDNIDPKGTSFRYADDEAGTLRDSEYWVDLLQFKFAMKQVFEMIDRAIRRTGAKGKPPKKRKRKSSAEKGNAK